MDALFSLSNSVASFGLSVSEIALLLFGIVLVIGLIGEHANSEKWKLHFRTFELLVIIGVSGELVADGGIFLFSGRLQTISEDEAARFRSTATELRLNINDTNLRADLAGLHAKEVASNPNNK